MKTYFIKDYYIVTGLRHADISDDSGEDFYHDHLNAWFFKAYTEQSKILIDLDDTSGYAPSFLDEAFGNLIYDFGYKSVTDLLEIKSDQEPHWKTMLQEETYLQWESRRSDQEKPRKSRKHNPWYKFVNGTILKS